MLILVVSVLLAGRALSEWIWHYDKCPPSLLERISSCLLSALALWIALNWGLSAFHLLTPSGLYGGAAVLLCLGLWPARRLRFGRLLRRRCGMLPVVALLPTFCWILYAVLAGSILPPENHDAMAYHLPKAVMMMQAHGYRYFDVSDCRISAFPCDYEILLADFLTLHHSDAGTLWYSTFTYVLCLLACATLLERWWGPGRHLLAGILVQAGLPIAILQSYTHKNDLMVCAMALLAVTWFVRWMIRDGWPPLLFALMAICIDIGTKDMAVFLILPMGLAAVWTWWRRDRLVPAAGRHLFWFGLAATACFLALGGAIYVVNWQVSGSPLGYGSQSASFSDAVKSSPYGDWGNLWLFPVLSVLAPYTLSSSTGVWVPWRHELWFWPHYEPFFSHFGVLYPILLLLIPLVSRKGASPEQVRERNVGTLLLVSASFLTMPIAESIRGQVGYFGRHIQMVVVVLSGWSVVPLVRHLIAGTTPFRLLSDRLPLPSFSQRAAAILVLAISAVGACQAVDCATHDAFQPYNFVIWMAAHPGSRQVLFMQRAGTVLDRLAGPHDVVAVDEGPMDSWIYPDYGAKSTRDVRLLPTDGPVVIAPEVKWVVSDRFYTIWWARLKGVTDAGQLLKPHPLGQPLPSDLRVITAMEQNPDFIPLVDDHKYLQGLFVRKPYTLPTTIRMGL